MQNLKTTANIAKPDDLYEMLIRAHDGLTTEQSESLNARLILVLMNHIGEETVLREALALAQSTARDRPERRSQSSGPEINGRPTR